LAFHVYGLCARIYDPEAAAATEGTVYFIAGYNYEGFKLSGTATETAGVDVDADSVTLYKAVLSSGTVTISKVGA
jgi:hypothetical protein